MYESSASVQYGNITLHGLLKVLSERRLRGRGEREWTEGKWICTLITRLNFAMHLMVECVVYSSQTVYDDGWSICLIFFFLFGWSRTTGRQKEATRYYTITIRLLYNVNVCVRVYVVRTVCVYIIRRPKSILRESVR